MRSSTSVHKINADHLFGVLHKSLYLFANLVNNFFFPDLTYDALVIKDFLPRLSAEDWKRLPVGSSPARRLSDLFWLQLPWERMKSQLGKLDILDVGCGSGNHGVNLQAFSGGRVDRYTGIDATANKNWESLEKKLDYLSFHRASSREVQEVIPRDTTMIISQSAVEHFEEDLTFFSHIRGFVARTSRDLIQIHLIPSSVCLKLYLFHGVRQYTPRTISVISRLFKDFSYSVLFRLGGDRCNDLHYQFITKPSLLRKKKDLRELRPQEYDRRLFEAIQASGQRPSGSPTFYALVIHSNSSQDLFL